MFTKSRHRAANAPAAEESHDFDSRQLMEGDTPPASARTSCQAKLTTIGIFGALTDTGSPVVPFQGAGSYVAAQRFLSALAAHSTAQGLDVFLPFSSFSSRDSAEDPARFTPPFLLPVERVAARFWPESTIRDRLQTRRYDALHEISSDFSRLSYVRSRFSDTVFPLTCSQYGIGYRFDVFDIFLTLLTLQLYPCDAIVCLSRASRRAHEKRMGDFAERYSRAWNQPVPVLPRCEMIPCGIDTRRFCPRDQQLARIDLGLPLDRPIVLCLGRVRIEDKMDWTPLLLAFRRVLRSTDGTALLVLAGGTSSDYGTRLLAQAQQLGLGQAVRTFFDLPQMSLPELYAASDVFVSLADTPSESFGLTVVEAMACGRPVVASDWDGYKDLIEHGKTGYRVRTDWANCLGHVNEVGPAICWNQEHLHVGQSVSVDIDELAIYLARLLQNRDLRQEMGRRGRQRAETLYDWSVIIPQWEALWTELSAVAKTLSRAERDRMDYMQSNYFEHFGHYASRIIGDDTPVRLTETGAELLAGNLPLLLHPSAAGFLDRAVLLRALSALKPANWLRSHLEVKDLSSLLQKAHNIRSDCALAHIMWLAKYGLVTLSGTQWTPTPAFGEQDVAGDPFQ